MGERLLIAFRLFLAGAVFCAPLGCRKEPSARPRVAISGRTWTVELATTRRQRYQGLSGRDQLPPGRGMLFVFSTTRPLMFCMRGCTVPIDLVYIGPDLRVVNVYEMQPQPDLLRSRADPDGLPWRMYKSHLPARYALELPGGTAGSAGIRVGDKVDFFEIPPPSQIEPDR